ncbi:hypothetical protein Tco_1005130 [Tanacetum coccineum]|uniref:Uncharacterized protein n=1 Tax=Tanacetum coccineum TaxID=301880 RepID=A0ABQ5FGA8_9ASTR
MEEADSDLESMSDDEVMSISGNEDEEADSDRELSVADEIEDDKVIDTLVSITNKEGTHTTIFVAFDPKVSSMYASSSSPITFQGDVQAMIAKAIWEKKNIPRRTIHHLYALGALQRIDFFVAHVHNLGLFLLDKFVDKMDSSTPRMVADAFEERMPELLSDDLKNIFPHILNDSAKKLVSKFDKRSAICYFEKKLRKSIRKKVGKSVQRNVKEHISAVNGLLRDILVVTTKHLQTKVERTSADLHELVELVRQLMRIVDSVVPYVNAATEGEK